MAVKKREPRPEAPEREPEAETLEVTEAEQPPAGSTPPAEPTVRAPAPLWVVPLYVVGFVLLYVGERVLQPMPTARYVVSALGVLAVLGATAVRFMPKYRMGGERDDIEKLLGVLSLLGVAAIAVYFLTTETVWRTPAFASLEPETAERVKGILAISWIALVIASLLPMLLAEAALLPMRHAERPEARRVRAATVSGIALALAAIYGSLFVYSADRLDVKVDYSYFKTSRPSESTKKIAESLSEPIDVVAFFPEVNEIKTEVKSYLTDLGKGVPNLRIEVQDRLLVPKRAKELKATQDGVIVLAKGAVTESLSIGVDPKNARPKLKTLDRDFQEKLLKLVRSRRTAYLTVGHGELNDASRPEASNRGVKILRTILQKQNYVIKDLGLSQGLANEIPDDADIVFVLGPTEPFSAEELSALERYGKRGGRFMVALDADAVQWTETATGEGAEGESAPAPSAAPPTSAAPSAKPAPSAAPSPSAAPTPSATTASSAAPAPVPPAPAPPPTGLALVGRAVGVDFSPVPLANERQHVRRSFNDSDRTLLVTNRFSSHASVSTLSRNSARAAVAFFGSGSLERAPGSTAKVDFTVRTVAGTFADANRNYKADKDEKQSVYNLAAAVSQPRTAEPLKKPEAKDKEKKDDKSKPKADEDEMRAFVLADADAFTDVVLANVVGNQILFADAVRWLGGEESFSGEVNTEEDIRVEHTKQKDLVWFYATIFGAPALVLGLGLGLARRGRRKGGRR